MDVTDKLRTWGAVHAQARAAEWSARQAGNAPGARDLQRQAQSLRERADTLHREIYRDLGRRPRETR